MSGPSKKLLGCWILGCSLLVYAASYGQAPTSQLQPDSPKKQVTSGDKAPQQPKHDAKRIPPIVKAPPASKSDQKPDQGTEQYGSHPTPDWWLIGVTGLLVIATAVLVYYARDTSRRQLRAYISIEKGDIGIKNGNTLDGVIVFKNCGQTPAYKVRVWSITGLFEPNEPQFFPENPQKDIYGVIGGGGGFEIKPSDKIYEPNKIAGIRDGTWPLLIWGKVTYCDIFKREWGTEFRITLGKAISADRWQIRPAKEGNNAR